MGGRKQSAEILLQMVTWGTGWCGARRGLCGNVRSIKTELVEWHTV